LPTPGFGFWPSARRWHFRTWGLPGWTPEPGAGHGKGEALERRAQVSVAGVRMGGTWREESEQMCSAAGQNSEIRIHLLLFSFSLAAK